MTLLPETVPADDRGLAYGDGCFETLRVSGYRAPLAALHFSRMAQGARRLDIGFDASLWWRTLEKLIREAPAANGVVKLILTRGCGGRGYLPPSSPRPRLLGQWHPLPAKPDARGLVLTLASRRLADQPALAGIKHLNRLEQVLARHEAARQGGHESLMLDSAGRPLELSAMNLFAVHDGILCTPSLERAGVAGVMRTLLLSEVAPRLGLPVRERALTLDMLRRSREVFASNSVAGVVPVRKLGLWNWPAGPDTLRLREAVEAYFEQ